MADDSDKQDAPKLPPKLNLRKQGILKQEPAAKAEPPAEPEPQPEPEAPAAPKLAPKPPASGTVKQHTARLVVKPADLKPAEKAAEEPAKDDESAPKIAASPAIKIKPLKPKAAPAEKSSEAAVDTAEEAADKKKSDPAKTDTKRKTSRIPLESARAPEAEEKKEEKKEEKAPKLKPKTIKIKPSIPVPKVRSTQPLSVTVPIADEDGEKVKADAAKRKTSRIPLEEALTADKESEEPAEPVDAARPKTIKIRRPGSEATTVKAKKPAPPAPADDGEMGKTARLDHLPLDDADTTPTQKKTIRVKRPDAASTASAAPTPAPAPGGLGLTPPEPIEEPRSDEPGVVWALLALAATLVLCVVIYMLAAQAFGPNATGTALSSWTGGPNLSWPGKIVN